MFDATKPLKASGFPILGVKFGKEITRASVGLTTGKPWKNLKKSTYNFFISVENQNLETKIIVNIWKSGYTVKPLYSGHPRFLKKLSGVRWYQLYRVLSFFEENIIIDKNLTIVYINCDSLQLYFLKNIWIVLW